MRQIRRAVFETNSSSTHSFTIRRKGLAHCTIPIGEDRYIHTRLAEFGWEERDYSDQADKLSYLVTMIAMKNGVSTWSVPRQAEKEMAETIMRTRDFRHLSKAISGHAHCKGVILDPSEGYIDHQSHENYDTFAEFLEKYNVDVVEFVFGRGNIVHTGNDNVY